MAQIQVYVFLREDCLISQHYSVDLREFHEQYGSDSITFIGLFPNQSSSELDMLMFKEKYNIPFELRLDHEHVQVNRFGATITPEVVVFDFQRQAILYQGRIDDTYYRVGKKRRLTSQRELKEVLEQIVNGQLPSVNSSPAVGCFIEKLKQGD